MLTHRLKRIVHEMVADTVIGEFCKQLTATGKCNLRSGPGRFLLNIKLVLFTADLQHLVCWSLFQYASSKSHGTPFLTSRQFLTKSR